MDFYREKKKSPQIFTASYFKTFRLTHSALRGGQYLAPCKNVSEGWLSSLKTTGLLVDFSNGM